MPQLNEKVLKMSMLIFLKTNLPFFGGYFFEGCNEPGSFCFLPFIFSVAMEKFSLRHSMLFLS